MIFLFKKILNPLFSPVIAGIRFCGKFILKGFSFFGGLIKGLAKFLDYFVLKYISTPLYKLTWRANRKIGEIGEVNGTSNKFSLFIYYSTLVLFIITSVFLFWTHIIRAQSDDFLNGSKNKPLIFAMNDNFSEEEFISNLQTSEEGIANTEVNNNNYLTEEPIFDHSDTSLSIPIDCDVCEESEKLPTVMEESVLVSPPISSLESNEEKNNGIRREINEYVVQKGDTISSIAKKFSLNVNTILWANNLYSWSVLREGQKLIIPPIDGVLHKVAKGENLSKIASKYKVDIKEILAYNKVSEDEALTVGEQLMIPGAKIITLPQRAIRRVSTPPYNPIIAYQNGGILGLVWPAITKRITQYFHWRHPAIDIGAPFGSPIYAIDGGTVEYSGWGRGYGWEIIIDHGNGTKSRYAHASELNVKKGDKVIRGQQIAKIGSTGWSTGPHLHIEIYVNNHRVNPLTYLK